MATADTSAEPTLRVVRVGRERAAALAAIHGLAFTDGWDAPAMYSLIRHPGARVLVAQRGREAVGFILGRVAADEAEILTLAVAPGARRRGVGRALVRSLADILREEGVLRVFLEVAASNQAALELYRGLGFVEVGRRSAYYVRAGSADEAAVVMAFDVATDNRSV